MRRIYLPLMLCSLGFWGAGCSDDADLGGFALPERSDQGTARDAGTYVPEQRPDQGDVGPVDVGAGGTAGGGGEGGVGGTGECTSGDQRACSTGCGVETCWEGDWGACETPDQERCNGVDDNCDGLVDEGFNGLGDACSQQQGECLLEGINVCSADGNAVVCDAEAPEEICNGIDDNCDGRADEDFGVGLCCQIDAHCTPGDTCIAGRCEGGAGPGPGGDTGAGSCGAPTEMPNYGVYQGDTTDQVSADFGSCGGLLGPEAVFSFQLAQDQWVNFDTSGSIAGTVIYIRTNCADSGSEVACNNDGPDNGFLDYHSELDFNARANVRYYVVVEASILLSGGPFMLNFSPGAAPPECVDDFDCAVGMDCIGGHCQPPPPECVIDADCPVGQVCDVDTCVMGPPECLVDAECAGDLVCENEHCVAPPECVVDGDCLGDEACVGQRCVPPPADICADTIEMAGFGTYNADTTGLADTGSPSCQGSATGGEVVFTFSLASATQVSLDTGGSAFDTVLSVRTACADVGSELECDDDGSEAGLASRVVFVAQAGVRYYVLVDGYSAGSGAVQLAFNEDAGVIPPDYDPPAACAGAQVLGFGSYEGSTVGEPSAHSPTCSDDEGAGDVTAAFVSDVNVTVRVDSTGSEYDTVVYVLDPDCALELVCDDDGADEALSSALTFDALAGQYYHIVVDGYGGGEGVFNLLIERAP